MGEGTRGGEEAEVGAPTDQLGKLQKILDVFEITIAEANDLVVLSDYEIVIIADDSGSMSLSSGGPRTLGVPSATRWDELRQTCQLMVDLGNCFDASGLDVYFLNRPAMKNVTSSKEPRFVEAFDKPPAGTTPLTECLGNVAKDLAAQGNEKPVLLFILTDGEPNGGVAMFVNTVQGIVTKRTCSRTIKLQIMACTDEEDAVGWLGELDVKFKEVDVTDDYASEKAEVLRAGRTPKFTRGDWLIKAMLGPISAKFDAWDEKAPGGGPQSQCCIIL